MEESKRRVKLPRKTKFGLSLELLEKEAADETTGKRKKGGKSEGDEEDIDTIYKRKRTVVKNKVEDRVSRHVNYEVPPDEECEEKVPFCCAVCHCSKEKREKGIASGRYVCPAEDYLWHRICCHGAFDPDDDWASPYLAASRKVFENPEKIGLKPGLEWIGIDEIYHAYSTSKSQEAEIYNNDGCPDIESILFTSEEYIQAVQTPFLELEKSRKEGKPRAKVLDCFAGIGTLIVVLKRLEIDIAKIVHVEHDKIATHVYRHNHDHAYNESLPEDGIEHVFIEKFEELDNDLEIILEEHGPFDLVVGGPPCSDFSAVNAQRQGVKGQQGQFMLEFGRLIRKLERFQSPHPLLFMAENVVMKGADLAEAREAFALDFDPIEFDAAYVSPTRRKRVFFTNIPPRLAERFVYDGVDSYLGPSSCLETGFKLATHIVGSEEENIAKANCLMASPTRLDERSSMRMYVFTDFKKAAKRAHGRPLKVFERENLMGYPVGYVETAVNELFQELHKNALILQRREDAEFDAQQPWRKCLPGKYHHFAGNYHRLPNDPYKFELLKSSPDDFDIFAMLHVKMAPPLPRLDAKPTFYNSEDYAKHLIGNAYSVPVVELLLTPLKGLFQSRKYVGYDYKYAWHAAIRKLQRDLIRNREEELREDSGDDETGNDDETKATSVDNVVNQQTATLDFGV